MDRIKRMEVTKELTGSYKSTSYYRGKSRCKTFRKHDLGLTTEKNKYYDIAVAEIDVIKQYYHGDLEFEEINEDLLSQGIEDKFKVKEATRDIIRRIRSDKEKPRLAETRYFMVGDEKVKVSPHLIYERSGEIEVVFIRSGKPDVTQKGNKRDGSVDQSLELWYGILYGRSLVKEGEIKNIKASYHFLRKNTDRATGVYDADFFGGKGGGNVVTLNGGTCQGGCLEYPEFDENYLAQLKSFKEGILATDCTEDDCKSCPNKVACSYQKSPEPFETKNLDAKKKKVMYSEMQSKIIGFREGLCRVIAKAGTGKTECMTERGAMLYEEGVDPRSMLFITFTDAGATEMKERLIAKSQMRGLAISVDDIPAMTFHSFGFGVIKDKFRDLGFKKCPVIIDKDEVRKRKIIDQILEEHSFYTLQNRNNALDWAFRIFDIIKEKEVDVESDNAHEELENALKKAEFGWLSAMSYQEIDDMIMMYKEYNELLIKNCWLTFADIEPLMNKCLKEDAEYVEELGYEHIIVDEFQDSNDAQMETIKMLIATKCFKSLMVVGDDCQSIYGFRNTSQENILNFWEIIGEEGQDYRLLENRRSTPQILEFADKYIEYNESRDESKMEAVRENGYKPIVRAYWDSKDEIDFVVDQIKKAHNAGTPYENIAILAFKRAELVKFAAKLSDAGIPWITKYPMALIENSRVQAALSLGMAFYQPEAESLYFDYVVCKNDGDIWKDKTNAEIKTEVAEMKEAWKGMDFLDIPYQRKLFHDKLEELRGNDEIYDAFLNLLYDNEDLQSELEYIVDFRRFGERVAKKLDQSYAGVVLTTAHSSKGLEWPICFVSVSSFDSEYLHNKRHKDSVEERRRLLYVAMTRARDILYVTGNYKAYGKKGAYAYNQFLHELYEVAGKDFNPAQAEYEYTLAKQLAKAETGGTVKLPKAPVGKSFGKEMTEEEIKEYNRMASTSKQMSITDLVSGQ